MIQRLLSPEGRKLLAVGAVEAAGVAILGCVAYCIWWWPRPEVPVWQTLDVAITCWLYCSTYHPLWAGVTLLLGALSLAAGAMMWREHRWASRLALILGLATLPAGLLTILAAFLAGPARREQPA